MHGIAILLPVKLSLKCLAMNPIRGRSYTVCATSQIDGSHTRYPQAGVHPDGDREGDASVRSQISGLNLECRHLRVSRQARTPGLGMDSMSKVDLAPGPLAVSNSKVATEEAQRPGRIDQAKPQHHKGNTWFLALTAIGIVYGDIGTSPLYAFSVALNATGHRPPLASDIIGIVSLTFWALLLMVSLKYVVFVLRADSDGEGGILALLALLASGKIADGARPSLLFLLSSSA